jgi:hypothetical protein
LPLTTGFRLSLLATGLVPCSLASCHVILVLYLKLFPRNSSLPVPAAYYNQQWTTSPSPSLTRSSPVLLRAATSP